jgi:glucose-6-phosphate 1-epimerase
MGMRNNVAFGVLALSVLMSGCVRRPAGNESCVSLSSPSGNLAVSLKGGRVLSWETAGMGEMFFMPVKIWSPGNDWSHGGISFCWPWFGRKGGDQSLIHGFGRNLDFTVGSRQNVAGGESLTLAATVSKTDNPAFPYDARLELTFTLTDSLTLKLKTFNAGDVPFEITEGFQVYFPAKNYADVKISGVEKNDFSAVNGMDKAFGYQGGAYGWRESGRGCEMTSAGNTGVVVWTPGTVEPANRNLAKDDCPKFIVIGPSSRAAEGVITVNPGASHELSFVLKPIKR